MGSMLRMKRGVASYVVLLILGLFLSTVVSADTEVTVSPILNEISPSEQAKYSVEIKNNDGYAKTYTIYSLGQGWGVDPSPLTDKVVTISGGESYTTTLLVQAQSSFPPGIYYVQFTV